MLGHPRNPTRFGARQAHMKVRILSEKLQNRIFYFSSLGCGKHTPEPFPSDSKKLCLRFQLRILATTMR
jgi:hypothetical protein